jgi:serine/threonine protein kinase
VQYCINPWCTKRENVDAVEYCAACGSPLLINERFRVIRPLFDLNRVHPTDIYEVIDLTGSWISEANTIKILKVLKAYDPDEVFLSQLRTEAQALQILNHPGIPRCDIDDFFPINLAHLENAPDELYCLAISKVEGMTLEEWIHHHGRIDQTQTISWLKQLSEIIEVAHTNNFIHRDIKPSNIIVRSDRSLSLIDFGGARETTNTYYAKIAVGSREALTKVHTLGYTAPEQIDGRAVPQSDFYSLGRTFINAMTGKEFSEIPRDDNTGKLLWRQCAKHIDKPVLDFIDDLTSLAIARRPKNTQEILSFLNERLPKQLKRSRLLRSKLFRLSCIFLTVLVLLSGFHFGRLMIADRYALTGLNQLKDSHLTQARESFERSVFIHPTSDAYTSLGVTCDRLKDSQCSRNSYFRAIQLNPEDYGAYYNLASYYEDRYTNTKNRDDYIKSVNTYKKSIEVSKYKAPEPLNNLARLLILKDDNDEALKLIKKGLNSTTNSYAQAILYKNLGWIYFNQRKFVQAQLSLNKSIILSKSIVPELKLSGNHCLLAQVLESQKQLAKEEWKMCFSRSEDSNDPEIDKWQQIYLDRIDS